MFCLVLFNFRCFGNTWYCSWCTTFNSILFNNIDRNTYSVYTFYSCDFFFRLFTTFSRKSENENETVINAFMEGQNLRHCSNNVGKLDYPIFRNWIYWQYKEFLKVLFSPYISYLITHATTQISSKYFLSILCYTDRYVICAFTMSVYNW